jgi:predicted O-methyltransferase YrrM
MNIANALPIEGWMEVSDLEWLARHASHAKLICEVGCWHGRSTICLADNTEGTVFAVDTWGGSSEHHGTMPLLDPVAYTQFCDRVFLAFCTNLKSYIDRRKVIPVHIPSVEAARIFSRMKSIGHFPGFDMIFIDAAHEYENIKADIEAWTPLVAPGGLLCGHDAGHPPVAQAVEEAFPVRPQNECSMWRVYL